MTTEATRDGGMCVSASPVHYLRIYRIVSD